MDYALVLYCDDVPEVIKKYKTIYNNDDCSPYIVIAKIEGDYEEEITTIFEKRKKFKLIFDKIIVRDGIIGVYPSNTSKIEDIVGTVKFQEYILDIPDKFYMVIGNKTGKDLESNVIDKTIISKLKLPFETIVDKMWILKLDKSIKKKHRKWQKSTKIKLN